METFASKRERQREGGAAAAMAWILPRLGLSASSCR